MKSKLSLAVSMMLIALALSLIPAATVVTQHASALSMCDWAQFVADVTVPDNTVLAPGTTFTKTWRLKNIGTCTWTTAYALVFDSGTQMGGPAAVNLPNSVTPGNTVDVTVSLAAPTATGNYIGFWKFKNASGVLFGIGSAASSSWWVEINVAQPQSFGVIYNFADNLCAATWSNGDHLPCPGSDGNAGGFVLRLDNPVMENGVPALAPGILMTPPQFVGSIIFGIFPPMTLLKGDRFQATVGCENADFNCLGGLILQYKAGNNGPITLWNWTEKYDGFSFNTNVSLNPIAGQSVSLVLGVRGLSGTGDRILWIHPVVVRPGIINTTPTPPTPTATPGPGTPTATSPAPNACDRAKFIADVSIPDGTVFAPNTPFTKTWRLKNVGTCTWTTSYALIFDSGNQLGGPSPVNLPSTVAPGQTVDLSINLTSPNVAGTFIGYWKFRNANGVTFGLGLDGTKSFWVEINVSGPTATPTLPGTPVPTGTPGSGTVYDFAANGCSAVWFSGAGTLPCPGTDGDPKGFVLKVTNPQLETGATSSGPGLVTFPQNIFNGYIQGIYPSYTVKAGDRFRSIVNCSFGQPACFVVFRLDYQSGTGPITTFWAFVEKYDGMFYTADLDLSPLVGQNVKFILTVLSAGSPTGDRALWVNPRIYNSSSASLPTMVASVTPTSTQPSTNTNNWATYQNSKYGFSFKFPPGSVVSGQSDNAGRVYFPLETQGTNLKEKWVDVSVIEGAATCKSPSTSPMSTSQNVTINSISFLKETGQDGAAGSLFDWVGYSTTKGNACVSLTFVLHSNNPGVFPTPPPLYDKAAESAVFATIMSTYTNL
jgi:Ig-like domain from next to BRCA1 gene